MEDKHVIPPSLAKGQIKEDTGKLNHTKPTNE